MLSLDQISFYPIKNKGKENAEPLEKTERERVAWTYCYLFDRQIAIRTGKPKEVTPDKSILLIKLFVFSRQGFLVPWTRSHVQRIFGRLLSLDAPSPWRARRLCKPLTGIC